MLAKDQDQNEKNNQYAKEIANEPIRIIPLFDRKYADVDYDIMKRRFEDSHFKVDKPTMFVCEYIDEYGEVALEESSSWKTTYEDTYYTTDVTDNKTNATIQVRKPFLERWLKDPEKRAYDKLIMNPDPNYVRNTRYFNIYRGMNFMKYDFDPNVQPETFVPFLCHMKNHLCNGNEEHYTYLIKWIAHIVQKPHIKTKVAVVLMSKPGAGKGLFFEKIQEIIGKNLVYHPTNQEEVFGNFNHNLKGRLFLFLDELSCGGNKQSTGILKKLITENTVSINKKMVASYTIANYLNVLIASNEDWVIPAGKGARRYFVLKCNNALSERTPTERRAACKKIINAPAHILGQYFYHLDISDFDPTDIPFTEGLKEQQRYSDSDVTKWWSDVLENDHINGRPLFCNQGFMKELIYKQFCDSRFSSKYINSVLFWKQMKEVAKYSEIKKQQSGVRKRYVIFEEKNE